MRSELVPTIKAGQGSRSGRTSQLASGPTSSARGLYSTPAVNVGANRYVSVVRVRARSTSMPGIQRPPSVHLCSSSECAVPRTARPSPGHTGQAGTRETGSCAIGRASSTRSSEEIMGGPCATSGSNLVMPSLACRARKRHAQDLRWGRPRASPDPTNALAWEKQCARPGPFLEARAALGTDSVRRPNYLTVTQMLPSLAMPPTSPATGEDMSPGNVKAASKGGATARP